MTFADLAPRWWPDCPGPILAAGFDLLTEAEQRACWAALAAECEARIDEHCAAPVAPLAEAA